jgi:hypothetical protein
VVDVYRAHQQALLLALRAEWLFSQHQPPQALPGCPVEC